VEELLYQVIELYDAVVCQAPLFWSSLLDPGTHLAARPHTYSHGSIEHMQLVPQYNYDPWIETPGAINLIRQLPNQFPKEAQPEARRGASTMIMKRAPKTC